MSVPVPAAAPAACVLRFEIFELDLRAGELRKGGIKLRLQGQPLLVLAALLKRAGNLVTREELRAQIWPADTFVDFDHSLHNAIARLRDVLGDSAELPRYIETLPRRGYRFIAAVEEVGIPAAEPAPARQASSARSPSSKRSKSRLALALSLVSVVAVGLALVLVQTASHGTSATPPVHSIAVLPLDNLSGDPSQEYFADGMTDELITDLAKIGALRVTSRTSVMHYKSTKKSLPEIARELNVDGIIEGSVTRSGKRVRITAQLLYAPLDQHLWAETYERDLGDSLKLQSDVAQAIAQQVRVQLTPQQHTGLSSAHRVDWLYSARGLSMEGDGIGLDGHLYHVDNVGRGGWITASGNGTARFGNGDRSPFWRTGGFWRTDSGALTYPLASGGWSAGVGTRYVPPPAGISFASGPSLPLGYLRSVAVDPRVIPLGSRIFIPAATSRRPRAAGAEPPAPGTRFPAGPAGPSGPRSGPPC